MIPLKDDNPTRTFPFVTLTLLGLNVAVFIRQLLAAKGFNYVVAQMALRPYELSHLVDLPPETPIPVVLTVLTAMFMHGGFFHIIGNMLYLWIFGNNVEDVLGHFRFALFYLVCGVVASAAHVLTHLNSPVPMLGASGAIAGVLGAYFVRFPSARVSVLIFFFFFIRVIRIPAVIVLGFWLVMQILQASAGVAGGDGVAWFAHIGGFVAGMILMTKYGGRRRPAIRTLR
ncbi:MAG: rhomboid family intramembrane serine protease [Candidatus Latescibacterota bacterium]